MDGLYCVREGNILFDAHYFFVVVKPISFGIKNYHYRIYSLIRRTIFYEKIYLFDRNLLKTRGASYNRVFSLNKI